jgi:S1-C subfamily serine protease
MKVIRNGKAKTIALQIGSNSELKAKTGGSLSKREGGQMAPYGLGFVLGDYSPAVAQRFGLPQLDEPTPVVLAVDPASEAARTGLAPCDIILDVNRNSVSKSKDALHALKSGTINILRILKQDRVILISLRAR